MILKHAIKTFEETVKELEAIEDISVSSKIKALRDDYAIAIKTMKLRIAKPPNRTVKTVEMSIAGRPATITAFVYTCPDCKETLAQKELYCPKCGQAIDWSAEDEKLC